MNTTTSNAERDTATVGSVRRTFKRRFINRKTLIVALQVVYWTVKIAKMISRLNGNS